MPARPMLLLLLALAWLALPAVTGPALAQNPGVHVGPGTTGPGARLRPDSDRLRHRGHKLRDKRRRIRGRLLVVEDDDPDVIVVERPPEEKPQATPEPAEPAGPPDPAAPFEGLRARGAPERGGGIAVGEPLPQGRPFVTLNWRTYGLPRPPEGEVYARIGRMVYRIEPESRRVTARIEPDAEGR